MSSSGHSIGPPVTVRDRVQAKAQRRDDAEVAASSAQRPEQVGLSVVAGADDAAVGEHDVGADEVVGRQAVRRARWPIPPPSVNPATPTVETVADGVASPNWCVAPSRSPAVAPPPTPRFGSPRRPSPSAWPSGRSRGRRRARRSPQGCDRLRGRRAPAPRSRAKPPAVATSCASAQRAMSAGCLS